jgi:hypothetical protein
MTSVISFFPSFRAVQDIRTVVAFPWNENSILTIRLKRQEKELALPL